jgi:hypothetical protein
MLNDGDHSAVRLATTALIAAVLLAGCGSSSSGSTTAASTPTPPASSPAPTPVSAQHHDLQPPCSRRARAVLAKAAGVDPGTVTGSRFTASNRAAGCRLRAGDLGAVVMLDSAPQPYIRMEREQVEFWQNVEWSHKAARAAPAPVTSLGLGGYWFPLQSRMLTTDGVRLDTIKVIWPTGGARRKPLAIRLAHVYLGPLVKPPGY